MVVEVVVEQKLLLRVMVEMVLLQVVEVVAVAVVFPL
jgi:hypothetical protein